MNPTLEPAFITVDIGASSGRVFVGTIGRGRLTMVEVYRFANEPIRSGASLRWDAPALRQHVLVGLSRAAERTPGIVSVGIDTWAIDYALLDGDGVMLENPFHYRDERTDGVAERLEPTLPADELYRITGLQHLPFTTVYQLAAEGGERLERARTMLLMPDLIGHWLTGVAGAEATNASTTGLLDARTGTWSATVLDRIGVPISLLPSLRQPGPVLGPLLPEIARRTGLPAETVVTTVASHDTASAVVAVPASTGSFAYISSGTWSLVGVELDEPLIDAPTRAANFSNERGVDATVRYLCNVMGLWLLQESMRTWTSQGRPVDLAELLAEAAELPPGGPRIDPDLPAFLPPGDMPGRVRAECRRTREHEPQTRGEITRCILDSLAATYARRIEQATALTSRPIDAIHVVGGGAQNRLLCQLTADACGVPVLAGPVEATAYGNMLVQARAHGVVEGDLAALRQVVRESEKIEVYQPNGHPPTGDDCHIRS